MGNLFAGPHLWIILIIILLLFGAAKLPALAKSMGQSARVFRGEMKAMKAEDAAENTNGTTPASTDGTVQNQTATSDAPKPETPPQTS